LTHARGGKCLVQFRTVGAPATLDLDELANNARHAPKDWAKLEALQGDKTGEQILGQTSGAR
jgi:hypothetical protein